MMARSGRAILPLCALAVAPAGARAQDAATLLSRVTNAYPAFTRASTDGRPGRRMGGAWSSHPYPDEPFYEAAEILEIGVDTGEP